MIAAGLVFGLRARSPPVLAPPPVATPAPSPVASTPPVADRETVARHAAEALAYHRPQLLARCAANLPATSVEFMFNVTFDAAGAQLARGTQVRGGAATPALYACVSEHLAPLEIPPPGASIMVELPLRLP